MVGNGQKLGKYCPKVGMKCGRSGGRQQKRVQKWVEFLLKPRGT